MYPFSAPAKAAHFFLKTNGVLLSTLHIGSFSNMAANVQQCIWSAFPSVLVCPLLVAGVSVYHFQRL